MITTLLAGLVLSAPPTVNVKVDGDGYLRFARQGRIAYAKIASLTVFNGALVGPQNAETLPRIAIPGDTTGLTVTLDGTVSGKSGGRKTDFGKLVLAMFPKGAKLTNIDNYYLGSADKPTLADPGDGLTGVIRLGQGGPAGLASNTKAAAYTGKPEIRVNPLSEVPGPKVSLGEVAEIVASPEIKAKLEQLDLGIAPVAGIPRPLVPSRIMALVQMAGFKMKDINIVCPPDAKIALQVQKIQSDTFIETAKQAVLQQLGTKVELSCSQSFPEFNAPMGELKLEAGKIAKTQNGFTVPVAILVDGKRLNSRIVNLTVDATAGAIKAGDTVRIYVKSAGATMEVSGRARTGGFVGQQITVVASTGSVHQATVLSASEVEVRL